MIINQGILIKNFVDGARLGTGTDLIEVLRDGVEVGAVVVLEHVHLLDLFLRRVVNPLEREHLRLGGRDPPRFLVRKNATFAANRNCHSQVCWDHELDEERSY